MFLTDLLANGSLAGLLADSAAQLTAVSILGFIAVKLLGGKAAPVRSLAAAGVLASMLCVFILSVAFHASDVVWYKADISRLAPKPAQVPAVPVSMTEAAAPALLENPPPLPEMRMENPASAAIPPATVIKIRPAKSFQLKAVHCINALGLLWAGGIIFMLLKLGYGLAFIRGFRFGLHRISDEKITSLLKVTAAVFNKQRLPELYTSPKVESPITIGLFNPIVIIPEKLFANLSDNELKSILLHELAHIYHCDHVIGVFKRLAIAANWWNPLAYVISAKHAVAREEVADNYVLRELAPKVYSECLAGLAEKICLISSYPAAAGMAGSYSSLEQRVRSILSKKRQLTMTTGTAFKFTTAIVCGALALFAAGVQGGAAEPKQTTKKLVQDSDKALNTNKNSVAVSQMEKAKSRMAEDAKIYSQDELAKIDELAKLTYDKWGTAEAEEGLKTLLAKYRKANQTGSTLLKVSLICKSDDAIKYYQQAITDFSDCYTERGVNVGGYARYMLGLYYSQKGENGKAAKLFEEIKTNYPDAVDAQWHSLVSNIAADIHREKAKNRNLEEEKSYSEEDWAKISELYMAVFKKWDSVEARESLNTLLVKYKNARVMRAWALLYAGQSNKGNDQIKYLRQVISEFDDCTVGNGVQIGPFARLLLARIYMKNGDKAEAVKLFEEIKTKYPDAVDFRKNFLSSFAALENADSAPQTTPASTSFWDKLSFWYGLQDLRDRTGFLTEREQKKADSLVQEFTKNTYLVKFKPVNGFDPATAQEFRSNFRKFSSLDSQYDSVGGASMFITTSVDNQLVGSYLTEKPEQMKKDIEKNPSLQFLSSEKVTPEMFVKYARLESESLMDKWKTKGPKILEISPPDGAKDVDPALSKITIKFDRKMGNKSWSVCTVGRDNELPIDGKVFYDDSCTVFTIPLKKMQPGHTYATSLNAARFIGFISADGTPLYPYPYSFTTRDAPVADAKPAEVKKDAAKPENAPSPETRNGSAPDRKNPAVASQMEKAWRRMAEDAKTYSQDELKEIESLYQVANKKWGTEDAKKSLTTLIKKYKKANRTGCALLYLGQMSSGDEAVKYFQQAIDDYSDCFYGDGVQIGAYARYQLACYYRNTERARCIKLFEEIKADYPDAVDHSGNRLTLSMSRNLSNWQHEAKAISRMAEDTKIYSKDELATVEKLYNNVFNSGWRPEEARESLNTLIAKYSKANRTGCALLYFGQISKGDEQVKYLQQAVDNYSDCFYDDGVQIGPYARLLLARIYLKNGDKSKAMKLFNEIKTGYPDAIDQWTNSLTLIMNLTGVWGEEQNAGARNAASYWDNFNWWRSLRDLHGKTGVIDQKDQENADALMRNLIRNVYMVKFKPVNGFEPSTPHEFLSNFSKVSSLRSKNTSIGGASFFRTTEVNNQLIGSFLTEEPEQMKKDIEKNPSLQFLSCEKVTPEVFVKYIESKQEALIEKFKAAGPKILEIIPPNGSKDVDPGLTKITVKFDRKMGNKSWAVCTLDRDSQLPVDGSLYYDDSGTVFTIPLKKLQPGHTYKTSLNYVDPSTEKRYISFVSADGTPLYPYPYSFTTKADTGTDTKPAEAKKDAVKPDAVPAQKPESAISAATTLANKSSKLTETEAAELEKKLAQNPEDIISITKLIGYYSTNMFTDKTIMDKREKYILWLIKNHPEAGVLGCPYGSIFSKVENPEAKKLWLDQLEKHPDDVRILENVAHFVSVHDSDLSIKCYEKLLKLSPENSQMWYWQLGGIFSRNATYGHHGKAVDPKEAAADFEKAFQAYENAYAHSTAKEKQSGFVLRPLIVAARKAGKSDKAGEYIKILESVEGSAAEAKDRSSAAGPAAATAGKTAPDAANRRPSGIRQKLEKIIFPEVEFKDADIFTVIRYLNRNSKRYDPDYEGVTVVSGFTMKQAADFPKITFKQTKIPLGRLLDELCRVSGIKYRIAEGVIVIAADNPPSMKVHDLTMKGRKLSAAEAVELEQQLSQNPEDIKSITMLLGYYSLKSHIDKSVKQKKEQHVLWLIENHPEAEVLGMPDGQLNPRIDNYAEAKKLWLEQLEKHPDNLKVLENGAKSFLLAGDTDLALKYFEQAVKLDPKDSGVWFDLGRAYDYKANGRGIKNSPMSAKELAEVRELSLRAYENAAATAPAIVAESNYGLRPVAFAYLNSGRLDRARDYAGKMIAVAKNDENGSDLIYHGNFILGMIAVRNGNIDEAGKYLLASVNFPPEMSVSFPFGPDMGLAGELLERGRRDEVLEFLKKCGQYWDKTKCEEWMNQINAGKLPDFKKDADIPDAAPAQTAKPAANAVVISLATTAAEKWLALIDDGKYQASWTEGAAYFKNAVTAAAFEQAMKTVRAPLGRLLSRKVKSAAYHTSLPGAPDGRYVVIQFETSFENKKDAVETVTPMADPDGQWRVSGYYIR